MRHSGFCVALLLVLLLGSPAAAGPEDMRRVAPDADGDGLSDFEEIHKYRTDPHKADSDGDGTPDGDWNERREYTYTIRCLVSHQPPAHATSDGWQDAREIHRDSESVELEIVAYPLASSGAKTKAGGVRTKPSATLATYTRPNLTNDFDEAMQKDLRASLAKDGIDVSKLGDRELVERVSKWAMKRVSAGKTGFTICYVTAKDGQFVIEKGLEEIARSARSDPKRSFEEQLDIEVRGAAMYRNKRCGSCTSTAVYLQTVLRALGVPTRTTVAMPPIDAGDPHQHKMLDEALRPSALKEVILRGAGIGAGGWVEHTINEVWVGGRWMRLNYSRLGQPIADRHYCGLLLRILDYDDRAMAGTARTWGKRYGLRQRSALYPNGNGYRLLSVSDRMGVHARVDLPAPVEKAEKTDPAGERQDHESLTITTATWRNLKQGARILELDCKEWFEDQNGDQYKRFTQAADRTFILRSDQHPDMEVHCGVGSITGRNKHAVAVFVPDDVYAKLAPGHHYDLVPRNESKRKWFVAAGVSVHRDNR